MARLCRLLGVALVASVASLRRLEGECVDDPTWCYGDCSPNDCAYGDYRVKGGTILDSFDSQCWRDHWQEEWGRPVGELSQYYFKGEGLSGEGNAIFAGGDNLAFVTHLSNGTRGDTLVMAPVPVLAQ